MKFHIVNLWKTNCSKGGFYFELFCLTGSWYKFASHCYFGITILNFDFAVTWKKSNDR